MRRLTPLALLLALLGLCAGPLSSAASASPGERREVLLVLAPSDANALAALARETHLSQATRLSWLERLLPTPARLARVAATARGLGLHVRRTGRSTLALTGDAATIERLFGHVGSVGAGLPRVPSALAADTTGALSPADAPVRHRRSIPSGKGLTGPQVRTSYQAPEGTPTGAPVTIATLQLSGWDSSELTTYAAYAGLPDPVASGQYSEVAVDGVDPRAADGDGDVEVALDQESLLGTAPHARQRAYISDANGYWDILDAVLADATSTTPDYRITALSISWGICEDNAFASPTDSALVSEQQQYQALLAAGVTVFAATGDAGVYDCLDADGNPTSTFDVDVPAVFPEVVGVGGTTLTIGDASTRDDDTEVAWSDESSGYGGGGGKSSVITRPRYQCGVGVTTSYRMVPDISAVSDPQSGMAIYHDGQWGPHGGTSLAAPLAAAMLTNVLAAKGHQHGVGDIHEHLYAATASSLRDITTGDNLGYHAAAGYDLATGLGAVQWSTFGTRFADGLEVEPSSLCARSRSLPLTVTPAEGRSFSHYRSVVSTSGTAPACSVTASDPTGRPSSVTLPDKDSTYYVYVMALEGSSCRMAKTRVQLDRVAPTPTVRLTRSPASSATVKATWSSTDGVTPTPTRAPRYDVTVAYRSASQTSYTTVDSLTKSGTSSSSLTFSGTQGRTYRVSVRARDRSDNSASTSAKLGVPVDQTKLAYSSGWSTQSTSTSDYLGSVRYSAQRGASATYTGYGATVKLLVRAGPKAGRVKVKVGDAATVEYDTYSSSTVFQKLISLRTYSSAGSHKVTITVSGTHRSSSSASTVYVDGVVFTA